MQNEKKMKIGVLYGGPSSEREISLRSAENVFKQLSTEKYALSRIDIVTETEWHCVDEDGEARTVNPNERESAEWLKTFDVFLNILHGAFGEDGKLQAVLDVLGVPYTGSGRAASALAMDKMKAMELAASSGIRVPEFFITDGKEDIRVLSRKIKQTLEYPVIVKPNASGSTLGLSLVSSEQDLPKALETALAESSGIIVQRYVVGREFTCGVLANHTDAQPLVLPPVEIVVPKNVLFDYNYKYFSHETKELCPAPIDDVLTKKIQELSLRAHMLFGCDGLSRSDFLMNAAGELFFLETNTSPGMAEASLCPKEALAAGMSLSEFLDRIIGLAVAKGQPRG